MTDGTVGCADKVEPFEQWFPARTGVALPGNEESRALFVRRIRSVPSRIGDGHRCFVWIGGKNARMRLGNSQRNCRRVVYERCVSDRVTSADRITQTCPRDLACLQPRHLRAARLESASKKRRAEAVAKKRRRRLFLEKGHRWT